MLIRILLITNLVYLATSLTNRHYDSHGIFHNSPSESGPSIGHRRILSRYGRVLKNVNMPNHWEKIPYKFQTYNEPGINEHERMPMLSNGFLGTTAKNSSLYVNGLYNGVGSESHRVRVPSLTAVEAIFVIPTQETKMYTFNCRYGIYETKTVTDQAILTQNMYVHRKLKNIIVTEIRLEVRDKYPLAIKLYNITRMLYNPVFKNDPVMNPNKYDFYDMEFDPENITFEHRVIKAPTFNINNRVELNNGIYYLNGKIPETEIPNRRHKYVHTFYTNVPETIVVYPNATRQQQIFHFIQSTDSDAAVARRAYDEAIDLLDRDPTSLITMHTKEWESVWNENGIVMLSDTVMSSDQKSEAFRFSQQLYASFYSLYASIPMYSDSQFYGLSPSGLAYGGFRWQYFNKSSYDSLMHQNRHKSEGYGGHLTYHQELWILPLISMFSPGMAKNLINSRLRKSYTSESPSLFDVARLRAQEQGLDGIQFSTEQAEFGVEVSPFKDAYKKIHTTADISHGLHSFLQITHSKEFLQQAVSSDVALNGEEYLKEFAKFWANKMKYDERTNDFAIKEVSFGEEGQSREVDNEAYTNYLAIQALDTYKYALAVNDKNPYDPQTLKLVTEYDEKMSRIRIPYDELKQLILEYDGYNNGHRNQETFVPFLNFPIQKQMTYAQKKSIYETYSPPEPNGRTLLTYASFLVGFMELNEEYKAKEYMKKQASHFSEPFQVLSELTNTVPSTQNNYHYLPGYASIIQSFISAYCGLRVRNFQLDIIYPSDFYPNYQSSSNNNNPSNNILKRPLGQSETWNVTGLEYQGNKLDILYDLNGRSVIIRNRPHINQRPAKVRSLEVVTYEGSQVITTPLAVGQTVTLRLNTDTWVYSPKRLSLQRLHKSTGYSDNINILASVYASEDYLFIDRPSGGVKSSGSMLIVVLIACLIGFWTYEFY